MKLMRLLYSPWFAFFALGAVVSAGMTVYNEARYSAFAGLFSSGGAGRPSAAATSLLPGLGTAQQAQLEVAMAALKGKNYDLALKTFESLATQGGNEACRQLGIMYTEGLGVPHDAAKGVEYFRQAADRNYGPALNELGCMYWMGKGVKQDYDMAFQLIQKAADQGYAKAQYCLGQMIEEGKGVAKDRKAAAEWYRKAQQGHKNAATRLEQLTKLQEGPGS